MSQPARDRRVGARDDVAGRMRARHLEIVGEDETVEAESPRRMSPIQTREKPAGRGVDLPDRRRARA